ncbi:MAG: hypothetical protein WC107_04075 [Patescibacteria group bacterium]
MVRPKRPTRPTATAACGDKPASRSTGSDMMPTPPPMAAKALAIIPPTNTIAKVNMAFLLWPPVTGCASSPFDFAHGDKRYYTKFVVNSQWF